jgi:hypothetical protein
MSGVYFFVTFVFVGCGIYNFFNYTDRMSKVEQKIECLKVEMHFLKEKNKWKC